MLFIDNKGITDPRVNLAIEEYALKNLNREYTYLLFYINEPSIIIGKNQNTIEEVNTDYVEENGIHVVRRLSGGGAVYHDLGNLNFSFVTNDDGKSFHNFSKFTKPVVQALNKIGVPAKLEGRNDIVVGKRKISGNAMFATKGRLFCHGTLLFDSNIDNVVSALRVNKDKIESKGIKSIRSRVANISQFLEPKLTLEQFKIILLSNIFKNKKEIPTYDLTSEDWEKIYKLAERRYSNWEWNYGRSPKFNISRVERFSAGEIDLRLQVKSGFISECKIFGDFFGVADVNEIENILSNVKYERQAIEKALENIQINDYFGAITKEQFINLIY